MEMDTPIRIIFMVLKQTHMLRAPCFSLIQPQLSTASRFQSGLSQQTEGIIYAGKDMETSRRERDVCSLSIFVRTKGLSQR